MSDAVERLVNLALLLASTSRFITAEQCRAAGIGYPGDQDDIAFIRMFERDKDALRAAGLVIEVSSDGESYRLDTAATFARPIDLAGEELSALRAVAAALAADPGFPFRDDLALALGKLGTAAEQGPLATTELAGEQSAEHTLYARALAEAVHNRKAVTFQYTNASGASRRRAVDPYGVFFREGRWYLAGRDQDANAMRTFAVERMADLDVNPRRPHTPDFERPTGFDVREHERLPFQLGEQLIEARVRFDPDMAWRAERLARGRGAIDTLPDGSAVWTVGAADLRKMASWILDQGPGLRAVEPPELIEELFSGLRAVVDAHA